MVYSYSAIYLPSMERLFWQYEMSFSLLLSLARLLVRRYLDAQSKLFTKHLKLQSNRSLMMHNILTETERNRFHQFIRTYDNLKLAEIDRKWPFAICILQLLLIYVVFMYVYKCVCVCM